MMCISLFLKKFLNYFRCIFNRTLYPLYLGRFLRNHRTFLPPFVGTPPRFREQWRAPERSGRRDCS